MSPKTTWEDLSNLGWPKQEVYNTLNAQRGNTMEGLGDLAVNDGICETYGYYCYNVTKGSPYTAGATTQSVSSSETIWTYDNTQNLQPFTASVTETWTDTKSATLSISLSASISLGASISIPEVGGSDFNITISTEATSSETKESSYSLSQTWEIVVNAGETVKIERTKVTTTGKAVYSQDYGLSSNSWIGTKGKKYNDHYYWFYGANSYLNSPKGTMLLDGYSQNTDITFKVVRIPAAAGSGKLEEKLVKPIFALKTDGAGDQENKVVYAVPGPK